MSSPVLLLGVPSEPPIVALQRALARQRLSYFLVDQRELAAGDWSTWIVNGEATGEIRLGNADIPLAAFGGVYTRLASWATVLPQEPDLSIYQMHARIEAWLETTSARVANRSSANDTNNSKPLQAMLIREHFAVPATLVTNDPHTALEFRERYPSIIYKSCSGERSIVTEFDDDDIGRLDLLATVPVQFQEKVEGTDVRVHVVGDAVFATAIESDATDYRYDDSGSHMSAIELADDVAHACVTLTAQLGLEISGIDLRFCDDGRICCFEVNPSPAYSVYEDATGQPIAAQLARHLAGG